MANNHSLPPLPRRSSRRRTGPTLTSIILERIAEAGELILDSFFPAKYPEARMWRKLLGLDGSYEFRRQTFSAILSQLKTQGLVAGTMRGGKTMWRITPRGRGTLAERRRDVPPQSDGRTRLVCFDIPERERAKRRWLRGELVALGYRPLQKSVWIGETPLPEDFVYGLDVLALRDRVHILFVSAGGTLSTLLTNNRRSLPWCRGRERAIKG